jgi:UDP-N-acetylmuramoyl-tripeptide--D-alanyl-D-alanine ligase
MIQLTLDEVVGLCPGQLDRAPGAEAITGVTIDSRRVRAGDLFVAVRGGVEFRAEALARGAAAALLPDDAFAALAALGGAVRDRSRAAVVGLTGSTGKTSTKDILAALSRPHRRTVATEASYNAELGVPLTLCRLDDDTELCVLELAMRGHGQIAALCAFARPTAGVITNIAPVHLERVGSLAGVAAAKAELLDALPAGAPAVVPAGVAELEPYLRPDLRIVKTGEDVRLTRFEPPVLAVDVGGSQVELDVPFTAPHQAENTVTALAAYAALGLPLAEAGRGVTDIVFSRWRGEELPLPGGGVLLNDCWNANPVSMVAALEHLRRLGEGRRTVAVLGDMAELGDEAPRYHREVGQAVRDAGVEALVAVGPLARGYLDDGPADAVWVESVPEAVDALPGLLRDGDAVLVKGSRAMAMERVAESLELETAA